MEKLNYDEFIRRMGYFRTQKKFSMRELSFLLDKSGAFIQRIEDKTHKITVAKFLEWLEILDITPQEFFYLGREYTKEDKDIFEVISKLSAENKKMVFNLANKLK